MNHKNSSDFDSEEEIDINIIEGEATSKQLEITKTSDLEQNITIIKGNEDNKKSNLLPAIVEIEDNIDLSDSILAVSDNYLNILRNQLLQIKYYITYLTVCKWKFTYI